MINLCLTTFFSFISLEPIILIKGSETNFTWIKVMFVDGNEIEQSIKKKKFFPLNESMLHPPNKHGSWCFSLFV